MPGSWRMFMSQDEITYLDQWTQEETSECAQANSNLAGGTAPEAMLSWSAITGDYAYLMSPAIDTSTYTTLDLSFRSMINDYAGGYNCYVKITTDGTTWRYFQTSGPPNRRVRDRLRATVASSATRLA